MTPDDVYSLVVRMSERTQTLQMVSIILKVILFLIVAPTSVMYLLQYRKSNKILNMAERHGEITDAQAARIKEITQNEVRHLLDVKNKVDKVDKNVEETKAVVMETAPIVRAALTPGNNPDGTLPTESNHPSRRKEDRQ